MNDHDPQTNEKQSLCIQPNVLDLSKDLPSKEQPNQPETTLASNSSNRATIEKIWLKYEADVKLFFDNGRMPEVEPRPGLWEDGLSLCCSVCLKRQFATDLGPIRHTWVDLLEITIDPEGHISAAGKINFWVRLGDISLLDEACLRRFKGQLKRCKFAIKFLDDADLEWAFGGGNSFRWYDSLKPTRREITVNRTPSEICMTGNPPFGEFGDVGIFTKSHPLRRRNLHVEPSTGTRNVSNGNIIGGGADGGENRSQKPRSQAQ